MGTTQVEHWFAFRAYNTQTVYGYGTADEADRYTDHLNAKNEVNHFGERILDADEVAELRLADSDLGFSLSIALSDIADSTDPAEQAAYEAQSAYFKSLMEAGGPCK